MGREYGGILGFLAFTTVMLRSFANGGGFDDSIRMALILMFAFAGAGYLIGNIAEQAIRESVLSVLDTEIKSMNSASETTSKG